MAEWRKVLVSGSNAHIAAITASTMGEVSNDTEVIFRQNSTGRFFTSGSDFNVKYTSSNGGQLYLENLGLSTYNITASGLGDDVTNDAQIIFWDSVSNGLLATSSLYFEDGTLVFDDGIFSGSFTGDGSGLTGVVGTLPYPLTNGNGIVSSSGEDFIWSGSQAVKVQINTASNGGLEFTGGGLHLDSTLPGSGLYYPSASDNNYSTMSVDLAVNSGLNTSSDGLEVNSNIAGDGLSYGSGQLSINLAANSGLSTAGGNLNLDPGLPGYGLQWTNGGADYSELRVNTSQVVTSSATITFSTGSSNLTLTSTNGTASSAGFKAFVIDNPEFTYDLNNTLTGNFDVTGDLTVEGNLVVTGTLVSASFQTENLNIADQFILLNSGSSTGDGGFVIQTSNSNNGAFLFYDSESARWGVSNASQLINDETHDIDQNGHAALVTVVITGSNEATLLGSTPLFGVDDDTRGGQLIVTTAPDTNESSIYIYA